MVLTEHKILHLNAIITVCDECKKLSKDNKDKHSIAKGIQPKDYLKYLKLVEKDVNKILKDKKFPEGLQPSDIHDFLEKNRGDEF